MDDTQPSLIHKGSKQTTGKTPSSDRDDPVIENIQTHVPDTAPIQVNQSRKRNLSRIILALLVVLLLALGIVGGGYAGYLDGHQRIAEIQSESLYAQIAEQFYLGERDLQANRYDAARQRFEYVFAYEPEFPGLAEKMAAVYTILYATATPTQVTPTLTLTLTPTITFTPTPDLRPIEERWDNAVEFFQAGKWSEALDSLLALRKAERSYQITLVDDMMYLALRQRGVKKIYEESNLEGGIYDLALAENFGPLDLEAEVARNNARMYLYGSSFWEAYPEKAVYFFSQVASSAPYLRDASGWTATERYRGALIQYGNQLFQQGEWCSAYEQFQLAASIRSDQSLVAALDNAAQMCFLPTDAPTISVTFTPTMTGSPTPTEAFVTPIPPTATDTPPPLPTNTPPPPDTPIPPTETPEPPTESPPGDTPSP